jgi:LysM repeat protein
MEMESTILRTLAVLGLAAAILTTGIITVNSGIVGSGAVVPGEASNSAVVTSSAPAAPVSASGEAAPLEDQAAGVSTTGKTYIVQEGDTFYSIAHKFNTSIADIQKLNPNIDPQHLTAGIKLVVP